MDELRGPTIQIVLHVKEGIGFGFLRSPFIVTGSLNGYMLETDPVVPCHAPVFDAELVWEADKRRFRSLRVQNVPIKVEVHSVGTQGRKDKVGYFLLSLLGAQPCPSNKMVDVKYAWNRLLGVKSEGKCCQPQLLMSLSIEDKAITTTPRNELRMFHSNEVACPSDHTSNLTSKTILFTMNEYLAESKKTVSTPELEPRLLCDEGLIQVGPGKELFMLSFVIGRVENLDLLLPDYGASKETVDCYVTYSVFTHNIQTDRVSSSSGQHGAHALFNQRTTLRLRSSLAALNQYFAECPHLVTRIYAGEKDIGICSMDLRKLVPTEDTEKFTRSFCNSARGRAIHERCFILRCGEASAREAPRRAYVDVEMTLRYAGLAAPQPQKPSGLTARSASQLESGRRPEPRDLALHNKSGSCTHFDQELGGVAYTHMGASNTARYTNASGDAMIQTNEIAELIRKMYDTFQESQEKLLASRLKPCTSDMQVQCEPETDTREPETDTREPQKDTAEADRIDNTPRESINGSIDNEPIPTKLETSKSDTYIGRNGRELIKMAIPALQRNELMQKYVEELEDWKEKQQQMFKCQLKRKEEYHLELLAGSWARKQAELERQLQRGVEQCRHLAADLTRATDDFRLRGFRTGERQRKLLEAKKALETHYSGKYQELRTASQQLHDDMQHQLKVKDMRAEELQLKVNQLEKQVQVLKNNLNNNEKENESRYSGLTKDQTASLIQELRCLEEKLDSAVQSKAFFKEQWGRAVRELHLSKLHTRRQMLSQLQHDRQQLGEVGLDSIPDDHHSMKQSQVDIKKLKDDFYVDLLANTPALEATSMISTSVPDGMEMKTPKNPMNDKLNELINQRDQLILQESPDEGLLKQLNYEIRNMLLNCGT